MPTCLMTGVSGFLGRHLYRLLIDRLADYEVIAIGRSRPEHCPAESFRRIDLEDRAGLAKLIAEMTASVIFHLAGKTPPGDPGEYYRQNTLATVHLLDALQSANRPCRVVLVGSAAELGPVAVEDLPVAEDYPCRPFEPYGASKFAATSAALSRSDSIEVVVGRVFNPIGPGLPTAQALGRFAGLLAEGSGPIRLMVGDLDARRDFIDVRDIASALLQLALRGRAGEVYHLGTGNSHPVREGLDRLIALSGRDVTVEVDPSLARNRGPSDSRADIRKILRDVGWSPRIDWDRSLVDLWDEAVGRDRAGLTDF
jgi:nucleoside-diphosphate-sugar epimerase